MMVHAQTSSEAAIKFTLEHIIGTATIAGAAFFAILCLTMHFNYLCQGGGHIFLIIGAILAAILSIFLLKGRTTARATLTLLAIGLFAILMDTGQMHMDSDTNWAKLAFIFSLGVLALWLPVSEAEVPPEPMLSMKRKVNGWIRRGKPSKRWPACPATVHATGSIDFTPTILAIFRAVTL